MCQFDPTGVLQWGAELHPMGARMGCYETPLGYYFNQKSAGVETKIMFVFHVSYYYECYDLCKSRCTAYMCKSCAQHKKNLWWALYSYPMPLCYSAKAALSYIAAGTRSSCGLLFIRLLMPYILQGCTITPHDSPECHAAPSLQTANLRGVE